MTLSEARGLEPPTPVSVLLPLRGEVHVVIEAIEVKSQVRGARHVVSRCYESLRTNRIEVKT